MVAADAPPGAEEPVDWEARCRDAEARVQALAGYGMPPELWPNPDEPGHLFSRHPLLTSLTIEMARMLDELAAPNFIVFDVFPKTGPGFSVTVQRAEGKSPQVVLGELRAELAEARAALDALAKECGGAIAIASLPPGEEPRVEAEPHAIVAAVERLRAQRDEAVEGLSGYVCASCGAISHAVLDLLDSGTTLTCDVCGDATVVDLNSPEVMADRFEAHNREVARRVVTACAKAAVGPIDGDAQEADGVSFGEDGQQHGWNTAAAARVKALAASDETLDRILEAK